MLGLRNDTEYVIKISFVLSGRKLGSESYRILSNDSTCRKSSMESSSSAASTPKSSIAVPASKLSFIKQVMDPLHYSIDSAFTENISVAKSSEEVNVLLQQPDTNSKRLVILEFVASWCGLCAKVGPQIEEIAENYGNYGNKLHDDNGIKKEVLFIKADIDDCSEIAETFTIQVLPSVLIIEQIQGKESQVISRYYGQQISGLKDEIESWINKVY